MRHCPAPPDAAPLEQPPGDASDPGEAGVPSLDEATRVVKGFMDRLTADQQADKALCMDRGHCAWEEPMSLRRLLDCGFSLKKYRQTRQAARQAASLRFQTACRVLAEEHPFLLVRNMAYKLLARIPAQDVRAVPGRGTEGEVDGQSYLVGSLRWMQELGVDLGALAVRAQQLQNEGATVSAVAQRVTEGLALRALMAFGDEPKPGAREALAALKARGIRTVMISGDNRGAAEAMARRLGLDPDAGEVMAEVLPGDKAAKVVALQQGPDGKRHQVAMVGDGVNDAPALAAADVGMAMGNGTDVAMHAAGITLMRGDPMLVAAALDISHRTVMKIRQNLFWAFAYNVAGIPLAALGFLSPVVAGAAMALSSVSVMANALLLKRWRM